MTDFRKPRRRFLTTAGALAGGALLAPGIAKASANERVRLAVIGCGGQGSAHIRELKTLRNVELVAVCDTDKERLAKAAGAAGKAKAVSDLRRVFDDQSIDAVTIATPDHWHAPAAIMAIESGKHVYVEKPCSHNIREGRLLLDAARRHKKVVQHGTQSRTSPGIRSVIQMLHDGIIGDVLVAKSWNWQRRADIGKARPASPPESIDYDQWVGPAAWLPYQSNRLHYNWHWWHNFGCGGIGNDGIHDLDYALWGLGPTSPPVRVTGTGGKLFFDDDQEFPDTQQISFEFEEQGQRRILVYEQKLWSTTYPWNVDSGAEFYGTKGRLFLSKRGKLDIVGERNRKISRTIKGSIAPSVAAHQQNWIDGIRKDARPSADIAIGHRTATVVHLGNICSRVGGTLDFDGTTEKITNNEAANELLTRKYREDGHWAIPKGV